MDNSLGAIFPQVEAIDECCWLIRFGNQITEGCAKQVGCAVDLMHLRLGDQLLDLVPSHTTLMLTLKEPVLKPREFQRLITELAQQASLTLRDTGSSKEVVIPAY